jgi:hypothetical protein
MLYTDLLSLFDNLLLDCLGQTELADGDILGQAEAYYCHFHSTLQDFG